MLSLILWGIALTSCESHRLGTSSEETSPEKPDTTLQNSARKDTRASVSKEKNSEYLALKDSVMTLKADIVRLKTSLVTSQKCVNELKAKVEELNQFKSVAYLAIGISIFSLVVLIIILCLKNGNSKKNKEKQGKAAKSEHKSDPLKGNVLLPNAITQKELDAVNKQIKSLEAQNKSLEAQFKRLEENVLAPKPINQSSTPILHPDPVSKATLRSVYFGYPSQLSKGMYFKEAYDTRKDDVLFYGQVKETEAEFGLVDVNSTIFGSFKCSTELQSIVEATGRSWSEAIDMKVLHNGKVELRENKWFIVEKIKMQLM